jgi:hypothetical protein
MLNPVVTWLLALMVHVAPPDRLAAAPQLPGHFETAEQKLERYESIATDLYQIVYDPKFRPVFGGKKGRAETAALALGVAFHEGGFAHDVDVGPCYRGKGFERRCDGGLAVCLMQIEIGAGATREGWTQADLLADRKKCFRSGISAIRRSMAACSKSKPDHRLSAYAQGGCDSTIGMRKSAELFGQARQFVGKGPLPGPDIELLFVPEADGTAGAAVSQSSP